MKTIPRMAIVRPAKDTIHRIRETCALCREEISPLETYQMFEGKAECNRCHAHVQMLMLKEKRA
jgi:hypothetical protein